MRLGLFSTYESAKAEVLREPNQQRVLVFLEEERLRGRITKQQAERLFFTEWLSKYGDTEASLRTRNLKPGDTGPMVVSMGPVGSTGSYLNDPQAYYASNPETGDLEPINNLARKFRESSASQVKRAWWDCRNIEGSIWGLMKPVEQAVCYARVGLIVGGAVVAFLGSLWIIDKALPR